MADLVLFADILECICVLLYTLLIIRIGCSRDHFFNTPFYTFFITTGLCGLLSVISFMVGLRVAMTPERSWVLKVLWVINHVGAIGSLLGKLLIVIHRYSVLRGPGLVENKWSRSLVCRLVAAQFLIPCTTSISVHFYTLKYEQKNDVLVVSFSDVGLVTSKYITTTAYVIYIVASIVLSVLTSKSLVKISALVGEGNTRQQIVHQQRNMFIIVSFCVISHLIKALHQAIWGITSFLHYIDAANAIWPFYPYVNGLATYTAPVILVICSSKVRRLFLPKSWHLPTTVGNTQSTEN